MWFSRLTGEGGGIGMHATASWSLTAPACGRKSWMCCLVPLLAVDEEGYRMGQGGGFYDSSLVFGSVRAAMASPLLVGWPMIASGWQPCRVKPGMYSWIIC
jgi:5-formyltetrahydrofolate cyclo-ligase